MGNEVIEALKELLGSVPVDGIGFRFVAEDQTGVSGAVRTYSIDSIDTQPDNTIATGSNGYAEHTIVFRIRYLPGQYDQIDRDRVALRRYLDQPAILQGTPIRVLRVVSSVVQRSPRALEMLLTLSALRRDLP